MDEVLQRRNRQVEQRNASVLLGFRHTACGRLLKKMMGERELQLRVEHYGSDTSPDLATMSDNRGHYAELMRWYTMLFEGERPEVDDG